MFYANTIYHVYNQSNNYERVFRSDRDYRLFKNKITELLLPRAELLCYCLMPTHFHFQLVPTENGLSSRARRNNQQALHAALRVLLSSYTRIVNDRYRRRGSLFRAKTKAVPAYTNFIPEGWELRADVPFTQLLPYVKRCFRYIHRNPVKDGLVGHPMDWTWSSARDYGGLRDEPLCNYELAQRLVGIRRLTP